jgi:hypothetical protein
MTKNGKFLIRMALVLWMVLVDVLAMVCDPEQFDGIAL